MTWVALHPEAAQAGVAAAVNITVSAVGGRFRPRLTVSIRRELIEGLGAWCAPGAAVTVQRGEAEHAGMLRLGPAGPWRFRKASGRFRACTLVLPLPAGAPPKGCRQTAVTFRHGADWLEITLPDWARAPAIVPRPAYAGISQRVPDPAKAIQAANGGRVR